MRVNKTIENVKQCICDKCPSYTLACRNKNNFLHDDNIADLNHYEMMFCAFEKSNCIHENRGCICSKCAVHKKYQLNNEDYCLSTGGVL